MTNSGKKLVVVADPSFWDIDNNLFQGSDYLAMSISVLSKIEHTCLQIEDFYSRDDWFQDFPDFESGFFQFLNECDQIASSFTHAYSYLDSGYWLLHRLSDLFFIHKLAIAISKSYNKICFWVPNDYLDLDEIQVELDDPNFACVGAGLIHTLQFLIFALKKNKNVEIYKSKEKNFDNTKHSKLIGNLKDAYSRGTMYRDLYEAYLRRKLKYRLNWNKSLKKENHQNEIKTLVGEDGYDIAHLQKKYQSLNFVKFNYQEIQQKQTSKQLIPKSAGDDIHSSIENYLELNLPLFKTKLLGFFDSYFNNFVSRLVGIRAEVRSKLLVINPQTLVFSTGATNIYERSLCREALQQKIPIFFMRHNGVELNFLDKWLLDDFCEGDRSISRTQFLINEHEQNTVNRSKEVAFALAGSATLSRPLTSGKIIHGKVLYAPGPPAHYTFKRPGHLITDHERMKFANELADGSIEVGLGLDVKVHPAEMKSSLTFFNKLKESKSNVRVFAFGGIERMIKNYRLVVIDILATHVLHFALYNELDVILYVPDQYRNLNNETFSDLERRVYLVRELEELGGFLKLFADSSLKSKAHDAHFNKKYFPPGSYEEILDLSYKRLAISQ